MSGRQTALPDNAAAVGTAAAGRYDKFFPGTGKGHIKNPHLFFERGLAFAFAEHLPGEGGKPNLPLRVNSPQPQRILIGQTQLIQILQIPARIQFRQNHNGKLQPLASVHAEKPDGVFGGAVGLGRSPILLLLTHFFEKLNKACQRNGLRAGAEMFKLDRPLMKFKQVGSPLAPVGQSGNKSQIPCLVENGTKDIRQRAQPDSPSPLRQLLKGLPNLGRQRVICPAGSRKQRLIKGSRLRVSGVGQQANAGQLRISKRK